ncbi:GTA-gp10 family protein [Leisingera sp. NJS201]|uniref:GTA-gp10 family protein n=1 Tax=Leisingera sp. NJS201 TaxID=2508306 RepID=UPI00142F9FE6|nr:GTA-gp10 family protein [Leisingera sp. NJS201]
MANKVRGEISAKFDGKEMKLVLSTNSICDLEEKTGLGIQDFLDRFRDTSKLNMSDTRLMFWALMLEDCEDATIKDAGRLIDQLKGREHSIMTEAVLAAFPDAEGEPGK